MEHSMDSNEQKLVELLLKLFQDDVSDSEIAQLEEWFLKSPDALADYWDFVKDYVALTAVNESVSMIDSRTASFSETFDVDFWKALAEAEQSAPCFEEVKPKPWKEKVTLDKTAYQKPPREISKFTIFSILSSVAAILFVVVFVRIVPISRSVQAATLVDSINIKWADGGIPVKNGTVFMTNEGAVSLEEGVAKFINLNGCRVVVESPAKFEFVSEEELKLYYGRVYTDVSERGIGYTISTPYSRVVDLGTSFGVLAEVTGASSVYVMKGKVNLIAGSKGLVRTSQIVNQQEAFRVSELHKKIEPIPYDDTKFVRDFSSSFGYLLKESAIDLVRLSTNNTSNASDSRFYMIDPVTGEAVPKGRTVEGDMRLPLGYKTVSALNAVDGVFVPQGGAEETVISSEGHLFEECPSTSGEWYIPILTDLAEAKDFVMVDMNGQKVLNYCHSGVTEHELCTNNKPKLILHANSGITYDLRKIKTSVPDTVLESFEAMVSMSDNAVRGVGLGSEIWILVDGKVRFHRLYEGPGGEIFKVNFQLNRADRFLTLLATDAGGEKAIENDWWIIGEPKINCEAGKIE